MMMMKMKKFEITGEQLQVIGNIIDNLPVRGVQACAGVATIAQLLDAIANNQEIVPEDAASDQEAAQDVAKES